MGTKGSMRLLLDIGMPTSHQHPPPTISPHLMAAPQTQAGTCSQGRLDKIHEVVYYIPRITLKAKDREGKEVAEHEICD